MNYQQENKLQAFIYSASKIYISSIYLFSLFYKDFMDMSMCLSPWEVLTEFHETWYG